MRLILVVLVATLAVFTQAAYEAADKTCTPVELVWVVDSSGTITEEDHERSKKFISTIQTTIGMEENGNKAAVVTYGKKAETQIKCKDYDNVYDFKSYVGKIKRFPYQRTNTRDGLERGQELLTSQGCGDNKQAQRIIVLLTDGLANTGTGGEAGLIEAAKHIQEKGIKILVVAIGQFNDRQLKKMVDEKYIHKTKLVGDDRFASLNNEDFVHQIKEAICGSVKPTKVNGGWSIWGEFGECSTTCGEGHKIRYRKCNSPSPANGGKDCEGYPKNKVKCNVGYCPIDGYWGEWSDFSTCDKPCGNGTYYRTRKCIGKNYGGEDCKGDATEYKDCRIKYCPIDGYWGEWSSFTTCDKTCGKGSHYRKRKCVGQYYGGKYCDGKDTEYKDCRVAYCPIHGHWGKWSGFSTCSKTCGKGTRYRSRKCEGQKYGGDYCPGKDEEYKDCHIKEYCAIDGYWGEWSDFSTCSKTCGKGDHYRTRKCIGKNYGGKDCEGKDTHYKDCQIKYCPIDGYWGEWSSFSTCDKTCGKGTYYRTRKCLGYKYDGKYCEGDDTYYEDCQIKYCPIDGYWGEWSDFSTCSKTCGKGNHYRTRKCIAKKYGGKDCEGKDTHYEDCHIKEYCPIDGYWGEWSDFSTCSATCGKGKHYRKRECLGQKYNGKYCEGDAEYYKDCQVKYCPVDGYWGSWSAYSKCSATCGKGTYYRYRKCEGKKYGGKDCEGNDKHYADCDSGVYCPVGGKWSSWSAYSKCSKTCGIGEYYRTRTCDGKKYGGKDCEGVDKQYEDCNTGVYCPIHGQWSSWSDYSKCSVTCGKGSYYRTRKCLNQKYGGDYCKGNDKEYEECYSGVYCPIDGYWGEWSSYSTCDKTCGKGNHYRTRKCIDKKYGGKDCEGKDTHYKDCQIKYCPIDGYWGEWSSFSTCSKTCGKGKYYRTRKCLGQKYEGAECKGYDTEYEDCHVKYCPINGNWGEWSDFSKCSETCGKGTHYRYRKCEGKKYDGKDCAGKDKEYKDCNIKYCPIDGYWGEWSDFSTCSKTCGKGTYYRTRKCVDQKYGGKDCEGKDTHYKDCHVKYCPIDGYWGEWSSFSTCSETCGKGKYYRTRKCLGQSYGGKYCSGDDKEYDDCHVKYCPINGYWGSWSEYSTCDKTCGKGTYYRYRKCEGKNYGGKDCEGKDKEYKSCHIIEYCPIDGSWGHWSDYSECSATCGKGYQIRTRKCLHQKYSGKYCEGYDKEKKYCQVKYCPVDGYWGSWSAYSKCSATCGKGTYYRYRKCEGKKYGGKDCEGSDKHYADCNSGVYCPVGGKWSSWSAYSKCSKTCGIGTYYRTRTCEGQKHGGKDCKGVDKQYSDCKTGVYCPVNGQWSSWSEEYSKCSVTCGKGTYYRTRKCEGQQYGGDYCSGNSKYYADCDTGVHCPVDGYWGEWSSYSTCDKTCGKGSHYRYRKCVGQKHGGKGCEGKGKEYKDCQIQSYCPVDGSWGQWSKYSTCSEPCGKGTHYRYRKCDGKKYGGKDCVGVDKQYQDCHIKYCSVDGYWGEWSSYSTCDKTCGKGSHYRYRKCDGKKYGGKDCGGKDKEYKDCHIKYCPNDGSWGQWSKYSTCSEPCGKGTHYRYRKCDGKKYGGKDCVGVDKQYQDCQIKYCSVDGYWGEWSDFSTCDKTCGKGKHYRYRKCDGKKYGGKDCAGKDKEYKDCHIKEYCPTHGSWGQWSKYSTCDKKCGKGHRYRQRKCKGKKDGGKDCKGNHIHNTLIVKSKNAQSMVPGELGQATQNAARHVEKEFKSNLESVLDVKTVVKNVLVLLLIAKNVS
uniref:VWFA domain-containing protein n=1 Tax=Clytia hemisphaerica TaxID=252671 RepID=A0A7M5V4H0_9CNID